MKILFISTSYEQKANSAAIRNNAWVSGLIECGASVDVLTIDWPKFMISDFLKYNNNANVIRTNLPELKALNYTKGSNKTKRSLFKSLLLKLRIYIRDLIYFPDVCKNWEHKVADIKISDYDVIISSSDFKSSHYVARKILNNTKSVRWIQVWGDPWSTDINLSEHQRKRALRCEHKLLRQADKIVYVSELTKKSIQEQYPDVKDKIYYIPRGYYRTILPAKQEERSTNLINMVYTGVLSAGRNITALLKAIDKFNEANHIKFELNLYGNYSTDQKVELSRYEFVHTHDSVDFGEIIKIYSKADILLFISNGAKSNQIPGKLFDYMGTSRPILCLCGSDESALTSYLSKYDRCKIVLSDSYSTIVRTLETLANNITTEYNPVDEFSPKTVASMLLEIIKK